MPFKLKAADSTTEVHVSKVPKKKGFEVDFEKVTVEKGTERICNVTWTPLYDGGVREVILLKVRGRAAGACEDGDNNKATQINLTLRTLLLLLLSPPSSLEWVVSRLQFTGPHPVVLPRRLRQPNLPKTPSTSSRPVSPPPSSLRRFLFLLLLLLHPRYPHLRMPPKLSNPSAVSQPPSTPLPPSPPSLPPPPPPPPPTAPSRPPQCTTRAGRPSSSTRSPSGSTTRSNRPRTWRTRRTCRCSYRRLTRQTKERAR